MLLLNFTFRKTHSTLFSLITSLILFLFCFHFPVLLVLHLNWLLSLQFLVLLLCHFSYKTNTIVDSGDNSTKQLPNLIMTELNGGCGGESGGDKTKAKTVELQEQEQTTNASTTNTTTAIYYPSPYASVQVSGGQMTVNGAHYNGHAMTLKPMTVTLLGEGRVCDLGGGNGQAARIEEVSQYATVKRTPRISKADRNIYDYPGEF